MLDNAEKEFEAGSDLASSNASFASTMEHVRRIGANLEFT